MPPIPAHHSRVHGSGTRDLESADIDMRGIPAHVTMSVGLKKRALVPAERRMFVGPRPAAVVPAHHQAKARPYSLQGHGDSPFCIVR